jgi:protoporphyrinogen oxidase
MTEPQPHVGVIGAGFAGLTAAYRLLCGGYRVTVFERSHQLGGLAMTYDLLGTRLEKYYHHLFTSDHDILALARELEVEVLWPSPPVGMFTAGVVHPFTTPVDLLRFAPLRPDDRVRFAAVALFLQRFPNGQRFEHVSAADWYRRYVGPRAFNTVIGPMLRAKFGRNAEKVAMVWMWGKLRLRGTSRKQGGLKESLGYIRGSFGSLEHRLGEEIRRRGGTLQLGQIVRRIEGGVPSPRLSEGAVPGFISYLRPSSNHTGRTAQWAADRGQPLFVVTDRGRHQFDAVLSTLAPTLLADLAPRLPATWRATARSLEYSGILCTTLVLKHQLSPIYWMYISDDSVPFGGLIEHTNYIPPAEYGGRRILYVSHYTYPDEEFYSFPSDEIMGRYVPHLRRINPAFDESWIEKRVFAHDRFAQPIVGLGYADRLLPYVTPIPGLFSAAMAQIFPEDRGTNYAVRAGNQAAPVVAQYLRGAPRA